MAEESNVDLAVVVRKGAFTHRECAAYLGVGVEQLRKLCESHGLPYAQPTGDRGTRLYSKALIDRWVLERSEVRQGLKRKSAAGQGIVIGLASRDI